jgi:hypothetical protein
VQERLVKSAVLKNFWLERSVQNLTCPGGDHTSIDAGQDLDTVTDPLDLRSPDERFAEGIPEKACDLELTLEGFSLSAEGLRRRLGDPMTRSPSARSALNPAPPTVIGDLSLIATG